MKAHVACTAAALAGWALVAALPSFGCGHCDEDKVAAVYDHGVINAALDRRRHLAFFAIEGPMPPGAVSRRVIAAALVSEAGVDTPSLRISLESASLSVSYDGKRISSDRIRNALNRKLAPHGLTVSVLKVMNLRPG